jgi:hypothetical protein
MVHIKILLNFIESSYFNYDCIRKQPEVGCENFPYLPFDHTTCLALIHLNPHLTHTTYQNPHDDEIAKNGAATI